MIRESEIVVVTGGRDHTPAAAVIDWMRARLARASVLRHGGASGVDTWARVLGESIPWLTVDQWDAQWRKHGPRAGPLRNRAMLDGPPRADVLIVFPGGSGTLDCVCAALANGIPIEYAPVARAPRVIGPGRRREPKGL